MSVRCTHSYDIIHVAEYFQCNVLIYKVGKTDRGNLHVSFYARLMCYGYVFDLNFRGIFEVSGMLHRNQETIVIHSDRSDLPLTPR